MQPGWYSNPRPLNYALLPTALSTCATKVEGVCKNWLVFQCDVIELLALCLCWFWLVCNHQQQTTHKPNTCSLLQGSGFKSSCSQFFFISFNLGIATGAKVGLKLRLHKNHIEASLLRWIKISSFKKNLLSEQLQVVCPRKKRRKSLN